MKGLAGCPAAQLSLSTSSETFPVMPGRPHTPRSGSDTRTRCTKDFTVRVRRVGGHVSRRRGGRGHATDHRRAPERGLEGERGREAPPTQLRVSWSHLCWWSLSQGKALSFMYHPAQLPLSALCKEPQWQQRAPALPARAGTLGMSRWGLGPVLTWMGGYSTAGKRRAEMGAETIRTEGRENWSGEDRAESTGAGSRVLVGGRHASRYRTCVGGSVPSRVAGEVRV